MSFKWFRYILLLIKYIPFIYGKYKHIQNTQQSAVGYIIIVFPHVSERNDSSRLVYPWDKLS